MFGRRKNSPVSSKSHSGESTTPHGLLVVLKSKLQYSCLNKDIRQKYWGDMFAVKFWVNIASKILRRYFAQMLSIVYFKILSRYFHLLFVWIFLEIETIFKAKTKIKNVVSERKIRKQKKGLQWDFERKFSAKMRVNVLENTLNFGKVKPINSIELRY